MKKNGLIIITPKLIVVLAGVCYKTALKRYHEILEIVGKTAKQIVTIEDYCFVYGVRRKDVIAALSNARSR